MTMGDVEEPMPRGLGAMVGDYVEEQENRNRRSVAVGG